MAEIEKAIQSHQTQAIITHEEMFKIFSGKVFSDNLDIQLSLKKNKESSKIETIKPVPTNFRLKKMEPEDFVEIQKMNNNNNGMFLPPIKLYDMANFYTDKGPTDPWDFYIDALVYELGCKVINDVGHVIKERTTQKVRVPSRDNDSPRQEKDRSMKIPSNTLSFNAKSTKSTPKICLAKPQMKPSATYHAGLNVAAAALSGRLTPNKSPTATPAAPRASSPRASSPQGKMFQPGAETKQMNTNIVHQLNMVNKYLFLFIFTNFTIFSHFQKF